MYSLGNIFYMFLTGEWPFDEYDTKEMQDLVAEGERPSIDYDIWNSTDPVDQTLKQAMIMCHKQEPRERATARQVETYLKSQMQKLDPGRLEEWGDA